ncbi:MAG: Spy/CpxP family protein refolding chaperone [Candidatus Omnitrophica bacterium]|nr:Spy/CpxP family protein refolding chaperone [Candidatus Omnitrophota bacterium]
MKSKYAVTLACMLMTCLVLTTSYAGNHPGKKDKLYNMSDKVSKKVLKILNNRGKLNLSDAQIAELKDLKASMKKQGVEDQANIDSVTADIKAKMLEEPMDAVAVNALIDKKYDLEKNRTKSEIKSYLALKNILTDEQEIKLKDLYKKYKKRKK